MAIRRLLAIVLLAATAASCRETGDVQVTSIKFTGASAVPASELKGVLATRESGFLPWSRKRFFDRPEFDRDVKRIEAYYADRGYPRAKVVGVDVELNDAKDKVAITVDINEGEPTIVETVTLDGFSIPADHLERLKARLPIAEGKPRDQRFILASHDMSVAELRDHGFPYGGVRVVERPGSTETRVALTIAADTGPQAVFGAITVEGDVSVDEDVIRRELAFREGDLYQLSRITETQRRIYSLELFQFVNVAPRLPENRAPQVPVVVTVAEGKHRRLQLAGGYGSEEKARGRINWRHVNFGGGARTGEVEAKASSLEQGLRGSFVEPYLFQRGLSLRMSGSTWWANEPVYEYRSSGGRIGVTKDFSRAGVGGERGVRNTISATFIQEYENYTINQTVLEDVTFRDELIALGLDPETGRGTGTVAAIELDFERNTAAQPLDPRQGYLVNAHVEKAAPFLLRGTFQYTEVSGEVRGYVPLGSRFVWANRARSGTLAGPSAALIPFYKRYFVGGSSSVRGWGRYQVSPLTPAGQPIGGRTMMEVSTEARFGIRDKIGGVLFVDGGNVWAGPWEVRVSELRWAVGPGIRYDTPIGPMRVDLGWQLNPIEGLVVDGKEAKRKWRVHFSIGQAF
ncbi:MAG TPA: BamA/TamA family outer membrane protein [Vicinamibacterales bacterium]|nr:BamA/TamA family outer membrane protein [Vicinamibacterales bacterium]